MHHYNKFKIESIQSDVEPDYDSLGPICEGSLSNLDFVFGFDLDSSIIRRKKNNSNDCRANQGIFEDTTRR